MGLLSFGTKSSRLKPRVIKFSESKFITPGLNLGRLKLVLKEELLQSI